MPVNIPQPMKAGVHSHIHPYLSWNQCKHEGCARWTDPAFCRDRRSPPNSVQHVKNVPVPEQCRRIFAHNPEGDSKSE